MGVGTRCGASVHGAGLRWCSWRRAALVCTVGAQQVCRRQLVHMDAAPDLVALGFISSCLRSTLENLGETNGCCYDYELRDYEAPYEVGAVIGTRE